jgi:hypothetical protein
MRRVEHLHLPQVLERLVLPAVVGQVGALHQARETAAAMAAKQAGMVAAVLAGILAMAAVVAEAAALAAAVEAAATYPAMLVVAVAALVFMVKVQTARVMVAVALEG